MTDEVDELIARLSPVQRSRLASADNGIHIINARMKTYRRLVRQGLIEPPVTMRIAVLTDKGQEVYNRLNLTSEA